MIETIAIAGSGTMGLGIAQICALNGFKTLVFDINPNALVKAHTSIQHLLETGIAKGKITSTMAQNCLSHLNFTSNIEDLKVDLVIEAIVEQLEPKVALFTQLAAINTEKTIFATNTSSIPITRIAAAIPHSQRVVGMHFFNPAHIMKLVEVISGEATSPQVAHDIYNLASQLGKNPVMVKDAPGFIVNRVARPFYLESLKIAEENVSNFAHIDSIMESCGFKMGPFKLMDLIGVDTNFAVTTSMFASFHYESRFRPSRIQQQKVEAGFYGRKTGKGFYNYN